MGDLVCDGQVASDVFGGDIRIGARGQTREIRISPSEAGVLAPTEN